MALRLAVAPGLLLLLSLPLIDLPGPYLLLSAMAAGINTTIIADLYGLDLRLASGSIAWSTAIVVVVALAATLIW